MHSKVHSQNEGKQDSKLILRSTNLQLLVVLCLLSSCASYKKIPYFQDLNKYSYSKTVIENYTPLTIQPQDILGIYVTSLNPEASSIFNYNLNRVKGNNDYSADNPVAGYLVDEKGQIALPIVGKVNVSGLTTSQLDDTLQKKLITYLKDPVVNTRILNFKISILGDVLRPNSYTVPNGRITLTEALSLAGDLNITAVRGNVLLVREINGNREYIPIDLTSKKIFDSPYFYLKNNDIIYVQPDKTKYSTVDRGYRTASLVLSGLSFLAIVFSTLYR